MTAAQQPKSDNNKFQDTLHQILLVANSDTLKQMVLSLCSRDSYKRDGCKFKGKYKPEPWILKKKESNEPSMKQVNGKTAVYCDFYQ